MKIWILEYNNPANNETTVTVWDSAEAANKQACCNIQEAINDDWNFPNCSQDQIFVAKTINDFIKNHQYKHARVVWNDCLYNQNSTSAVFWHVFQSDVYEADEADEPIIRDDAEFTTVTASTITTTSEVSDTNKPYKAAAPGATCRKCHNSNEYAYADHPNGTYVCRGCAIFKEIFSS
jgi:hypothetical protein